MADYTETTQRLAQSSSTNRRSVSAVLSAIPALLAFATLRGRRLSDERSRPAQFFLSPDPPPPQLS